MNYIDTEYTWEGGDVPNLSAGFVASETCNALHARIAELEAEREAAQLIWSQTCDKLANAEKERDELRAELDVAKQETEKWKETVAHWWSNETDFERFWRMERERQIMAEMLDAANAAKARAEADARRLATMYRMNEDIVTHIADCSYCRAYHYDCAERGEAVTALAIYRIDTDGDTIAAKYLEEK